MMQQFVRNPPWADKAILNDWPKIVRFCERHGLPLPTVGLTVDKKIHWQEYGCGTYGCVYPSDKAKLVSKITSDQQEIDFTLRVCTQHIELPGLVRYYAVLPLTSTWDKRRLALIWREDARMAGELPAYANQQRNKDVTDFARWLDHIRFYGYQANTIVWEHKRPRRLLEKLSEHIATVLPDVRAAKQDILATAGSDGANMVPVADEPPPFEDVSVDESYGLALAWFVSAYATVVDAIKANPLGHLVGDALERLLAQSILLGDIHNENVGLCVRDGKEQWVITDPGQQLLLNPTARVMPFKSWAAEPDKMVANDSRVPITPDVRALCMDLVGKAPSKMRVSEWTKGKTERITLMIELSAEDKTIELELFRDIKTGAIKVRDLQLFIDSPTRADATTWKRIEPFARSKWGDPSDWELFPTVEPGSGLPTNIHSNHFDLSLNEFVSRIVRPMM